MGVIKADQLLARRARAPEIRVPILAPPMATPAAINPERLVELEDRVAELEENVARLRAEKAELEAALEAAEIESVRRAAASEAAVAEAEASGRDVGFAEGAEAKAESIAVLEAAADRAMDQFRTDLRGMETLAVALSKAALAKVFGDDRDMAYRVARLVRRQVEVLDRDAVLRVEVAATDFSDAAAVEGLLRDAGLDGIEVRPVDELGTGGCRIRLRLGELDVGLSQQWSRLGALLDETLAVEGA
jgi:flagellar assembly protein FliH